MDREGPERRMGTAWVGEPEKEGCAGWGRAGWFLPRPLSLGRGCLLPGSSQVSMVMVAGAPFTATKMSLVSLAGNRPALHPPQYPLPYPPFSKN